VKKYLFYTILIITTLSLWECQPILKAPAAAIMSTTLPNPEIDSTTEESSFPKADFNLQVKDLEGNLVKMTDYRGKVIFLNFWATWCMPCVAELPSINKLYLELKEENIAFLLVSNEKNDKVKNYHSKKGYQIPFHIIDDDGNIPNIYFSPSIPSTFIINKKGRIIRKSFGAEDWDDKEFIKEIRKLL
jgi:thiol-disulfide isomerase/thioredoxin